MYEELKNVMSQDSADELMGYLPPVGWADVAMKSDLAMIRHEMDAMRADLLGEMHKGFAAQTRWLIGMMFVAMTFGITVANAIN